MAGGNGGNPDKLKVHDNGVVVVPTMGKIAPGHQKGTFHMRVSDYGGGGGHHMELTPGAEDVWAEWKLDKDGVFGSPREYLFSMRLQTDCEYNDDDGPLQLSVRVGKDEPFLETTVAIPNTSGEWAETEPVSIGEIGGAFQNTKFKILVPQVQGQLFNIREFVFTPPGADETGEYSGPWFTEWLEDLKTKLIYKLPTLSSDAEADALESASRAYRDSVKEEHAANDQKDKEAQARAKAAMDASYNECFEAAKPLLDEIDKSSLSMDDLSLLQFLVLVQATPNALAAYCYQGEEKVQRLMHLLKEDMELLKQFLLNGGAKRGFFGQALDIYHDIQEQQEEREGHISDVLQRLALAVALELCDPIQEFDSAIIVDPVERYLHYEKAYLNGELDPAFETLTAWEIRNVVNCDAPNQQIQWCRDMLFNYRPDIAYMGEPLWRYSSIVKTDVKFGRPDWIRDQRDYYQMFARGGKCGIRAMCGRLVNKASGIPCVPVLQPSHGALAKWSPKGWHCVLGGDVGRCGDRSFFDFQFETNVRMSLGNETYLLKVEILDWMAVLMNEKQTDSFPDPKCPWHTLALVQRKRLGEMDETKQKDELNHCNVIPRILEIRQREEPDKEEVVVDDNGTIVVPMSARDKDHAVVFMKSRDSGRQMNAKENWWVEYKLPKDLVSSERQKYTLTMKICSIHDNDPKPFQWIIKSPHCSEKPIMEYTVPFPYTCGSWAETDPIEIELGGGEETLKLMRQKPCWPVTVKEFKLTPLE